MFVPNSRAQLAALEAADFCDEVIYAGERGGGKSHWQCGYQEDGALRYGKASRGIMFRKTYAEMEELQAAAMMIFPSSGAVFKTRPSANYPFSNCWYFPNGATVKVRYLEAERDYGRYHGHQYCVAADTPILMADGSWRRIDGVRVGDMVQTLAGPRRVLATIKPYLAPCVVMVTPFGSQVHPTWHPVLASASASGKGYPSGYQDRAPSQEPPLRWLTYESLLADYQATQGRAASPRGAGIDCGASDGSHQAGAQPLPLSFRAALYEPSIPSGALAQQSASGCHDVSGSRSRGEWTFQGIASTLWGLLRPSLFYRRLLAAAPWRSAASGARRARPESETARGYPGDCCQDCRQCDGRPLCSTGADRESPPSPTGAASPSRSSCETGRGGPGSTPGCTRLCAARYEHPAVVDRVETSCAPVVVVGATMRPCGERLVSDLTVEGQNHYITSCAINSQTRVSFDEVTEYASPTPVLKMLSTLRSVEGVPCSIGLTGNPGGIGHVWMRARLFMVPPLSIYDDPETGMGRIFVPSKLKDNRDLILADPRYISRLMAATQGNEALRKAWLEGDWDVLAGAFFSNFSRELHVIKPFPIPTGWTRFASFDWGSARPFSVGWWAVSNGEPVRLEGGRVLWFPAGAIIRYREWYGKKSDEHNIGLKMVAEAVAQGIVDREKRAGERLCMPDEQHTGPRIAYRVADPACWKEDGGPSIAERMQRAGCIFRQADNSRITGWDQVRARLEGDDGAPMLYVFNTCVDLIRTLPALIHDEDKLEDLDTDGEDHAADEARYACMSRPLDLSVKKRKSTEPKPYTYDWLEKHARGDRPPVTRSKYRMT